MFLRSKKNQEAPLQIGSKDLDLVEAADFVQKMMLDEEHIDASLLQHRQSLLRDSTAGDLVAVNQLKQVIINILQENNKTVRNMSLENAAHKIYAQNWGMGPVEDLNRDPEVEEIRVNSPNHVFVQRKGKNEKTTVCFKDEAEVENVIKRQIAEDTGISLDTSSPIIESVRPKDGARLTATCPPVSKTWTFVLRKHNTFDVTVENLTRAYSLNTRVWDALSLLGKGRANILFSGPSGSGKTTLMRKLIGELNPNLRLLVIGKDRELRLSECYPDRDILEFEAHPEKGAPMKKLFETALRESPDALFIEEFRGTGEAIEAIKACTRGLLGSMATAHFNSAYEALEGTGHLMLEEGLDIPLEMARLRVARAFDIVVQMFGDTVNGVRKVISITEIVVENDQLLLRDLIHWIPTGQDFMKEGRWEFVGIPNDQLVDRMTRFGVSLSEIERVFKSG